MNPSIWNKRIPTLAGLILLMIGILITSASVQKGSLLPLQASSSEEPIDTRISNVSDTSITISYRTAIPVTGSLTYGTTTNFGSVALDDRDRAGNTLLEHNVHIITLTNLQPKTTYHFAIVSGKNTYRDTTYMQQTAPTVAIGTTQEKTLHGTLLLPDGTKPTEALVYIESTGSQLLSTLATDGIYSISLTKIRTDSLQAYTQLSADTTLVISATSGTLHSTAEATASQLDIPQITLSQQYEFTANDVTPSASVTSPTGEQQATASGSFPHFSSDTSINSHPQILTPQKDEAFIDLQPEFTGTALPGRTVEVHIESTQEINTTVTADQTGRWTFRPAKPLEPGKHTVTITTRNEAGIMQTILQSFVVNAQGSQFTEPSVSPTKTPSPTPMLPTKSPTSTVTPTAVSTVTTQPSPTTRPTLPLTTVTVGPTQIPIGPPGSQELIITAGLAGFAILLGGMIFFFAH